MKKASKAAEPAVEPAVVLFGYDEGKRPHAAWFGKADADLAERAAALMSMNVMRLTTDEHRAAASAAAAGRIFQSGKAFVPFCSEQVYDRLARFNGSFKPEPPPLPTAALPEPGNIPATWADVQLHSLVLARDPDGTGWFESIVTEAKGDLLALRWCHWPDLPPFLRRAEHVSLLSASAHQAVAEAASEAASDPSAA